MAMELLQRILLILGPPELAACISVSVPDDFPRTLCTPQPWAHVEAGYHHARSSGRARAGCRWSTEEYARLMSSVRDSG